MSYPINEQIYFDMAVETLRLQYRARANWFRKMPKNRQIRIDTMRTSIAMMRDIRQFKRCGRARP